MKFRCILRRGSVRKVVLFIIITLIKIIKRTMAIVKNWIEEQLLLVKQALQQPIVPNTPRNGVLQYCQHCKVGELIAEALLRNILREIALSKITEGQSDIMIRRQFI